MLLLYFLNLFFYCSLPFVSLAGPLLTDLYYFLVSRLESWYRELIVKYILFQLFSSEFSSFFLNCPIQIWWMILFMIQFFIYVILSLYLVVCAYMCAILLVIDSLRYIGRDFTLHEYLLAIVAYLYSVF